MRYPHISILLFALLAAPLFAQQVRLDATEKSFGDMRPLENRSLSFTVYNDGPGVAHLAQPRPSCGCTATILSNAELAPGDSAQIEVRFNAAPGMIGSIDKTIALSLHEDGGQRQIATLRIHARVVGDVIYHPGLLHFASAIGDTVVLQLTLLSNSVKPVKIENISVSILAYVDTTEGNKYHVEQVQAWPFTNFDMRLETSELLPDDSTRLYLTLRPTEKGQINGAIRIPIPDGELRVPVNGVVLRTRAP
jgi:hypothetical protein